MQDIEIKFSVGCMVRVWCLGMPVQNWSDFIFTITGMALLATAAELVLLLILLVYIIPSPGKKPTEYIDSLEKNYHQRILFCLTLAEFLTWIILIPFEIKPSAIFNQNAVKTAYWPIVLLEFLTWALCRCKEVILAHQ